MCELLCLLLLCAQDPASTTSCARSRMLFKAFLISAGDVAAPRACKSTAGCSKRVAGPQAAWTNCCSEKRWTCCMHFCFSLSDFTSTQVHEGARPDLCTVWPFDTWILSSIVSSHILELLCLSTECGGDGGSKSPVEISINILKCVMKCLAPAMWLPSSSQIVLK